MPVGFPFGGGSASLAIGSPVSGSTPGSVLFIDGSNQLAQDNANLFWDDTNNILKLAAELDFQATTALFKVNGSLRLDFDSTNTGQWTITAPPVGGNTPGLTIDAGSGDAGAYINLVGRNAGVASLARVFADNTGVLNLSSTNGQVQLTSAVTTFTGFVVNNTSVGGKQYVFVSSGSAGAHGAGLLELYDQSGAVLTSYFYNGTNTLFTLNSTTLLGFANSVFGGAQDVAFFRNAAGVIEINNGTSGTFRDLKLRDIFTNDATFFTRSIATLTNNAAAAAGTLLNAPAAGNPTKWIGIDDNGTTRFIPAW